MAKQTCSKDGCNVEVSSDGWLFDGKAYCRQHYWDALYCEFRSHYDNWKQGEEPSSRFKSLLGRISSEEKWIYKGNSYLSQARIRDRGYGFNKTDNGCTFKITRHLNGFDSKKLMRRVVETWRANISEKQLELLDSRKWKEGDHDL